jgi:hypothetical protein
VSSVFNWKTYEVAGFTYQADLYCPGCTAMAIGWKGDGPETAGMRFIERVAEGRGIDMDDQESYDSADFPEPVFAEHVASEDVCAGCGGQLL